MNLQILDNLPKSSDLFFSYNKTNFSMSLCNLCHLIDFIILKKLFKYVFFTSVVKLVYKPLSDIL